MANALLFFQFDSIMLSSQDWITIFTFSSNSSSVTTEIIHVIGLQQSFNYTVVFWL